MGVGAARCLCINADIRPAPAKEPPAVNIIESSISEVTEIIYGERKASIVTPLIRAERKASVVTPLFTKTDPLARVANHTMSTGKEVEEIEEVDPSLDIKSNEERLATTRRVSRIITEQSVQERLARKLSKEAKPEPGTSEADIADLDDSVNIEQTEQKLFKARRVSQHSYKERLSQKRDSRLAKRSHSIPNEESSGPAQSQ